MSKPINKALYGCIALIAYPVGFIGHLVFIGAIYWGLTGGMEQPLIWGLTLLVGGLGAQFLYSLKSIKSYLLPEAAAEDIVNAIKNNNKDGVKTISDYGDNNYNFNKPVIENDTTPLMLAIKLNRYKVITKLIDCGADINSQDGEGISVLDYIENSSNPNRLKKILISYAIDSERLDMLKDFLKREWDFNIFTYRYSNYIDDKTVNEDYTPLMEAIEKRKVKIVKLLLKNGVDRDFQNKNGLSAKKQADSEVELSKGYNEEAKMKIQKIHDLVHGAG
jgi:Ankyrin repeats (3 copies)/Ankyrin repeat